MHTKTKKTVFAVFIICTVLSILFVREYRHAKESNARGSAEVNLAHEGLVIADCIRQCQRDNDPLVTLIAQSTNSTEVLAELQSYLGNDQMDDDGSRTLGGLHDWTLPVERTLRPQLKSVTTSNNVWVIVKNLPTNAPGQTIVVATRNVDARHLLTRMDKTTMNQPVPVLFEQGKGLLSQFAVVIRKDGCFTRIRLRSTFKGMSFSSWYGSEPFALVACGTNSAHVTYLTPNGEVTPDQ